MEISETLRLRKLADTIIAYSYGNKTIQYKKYKNDDGIWTDVEHPSFNCDAEWRIKPEPEYIFRATNSANNWTVYKSTDTEARKALDRHLDAIKHDHAKDIVITVKKFKEMEDE